MGSVQYSDILAGAPAAPNPHAGPSAPLVGGIEIYIEIPKARLLPIGVRGVLRALLAVAAGKVAMCEKVSRHP